VLKETWTTVLELMMVWICSRSYVAAKVSGHAVCHGRLGRCQPTSLVVAVDFIDGRFGIFECPSVAHVERWLRWPIWSIVWIREPECNDAEKIRERIEDFRERCQEGLHCIDQKAPITRQLRLPSAATSFHALHDTMSQASEPLITSRHPTSG
jgi:hypothetical protein